MNDIVKTVLVKGGKDGPVRVNESDYDENIHGPLHKAKAANEDNEKPVDTVNSPTQISADTVVPPTPSMPDVKEPVSPVTVEPTQKFVAKKGKKFIVVDASGNAIESDGIDAGGYADEKTAWNAIMALPH